MVVVSSTPQNYSGNQKRWRQTGSRQSIPLSTRRTRYGNAPQKLHTDRQTPAEFSPKGKSIRNFSIDPTSSMWTRSRTPFLRTPFLRLLRISQDRQPPVTPTHTRAAWSTEVEGRKPARSTSHLSHKVHFRVLLLSGRKEQPKDKVFGQDIFFFVPYSKAIPRESAVQTWKAASRQHRALENAFQDVWV